MKYSIKKHKASSTYSENAGNFFYNFIFYLFQEECMQRCKYLSDLVRKQKQKETEEQQKDDESLEAESQDVDSA